MSVESASSSPKKSKVVWVLVRQQDNVDGFLEKHRSNPDSRVIAPYCSEFKQVLCLNPKKPPSLIVIDGINEKWGMKKRSLIDFLITYEQDGTFRFNGIRRDPKNIPVIVLSRDAPWDVDTRICKNCGVPYSVVNGLENSGC